MATDDIDTATDTPSTWPPPIYAQSHGEPENTSGTNTTVPYVVARMTWCWGGFVLPLFWSFANRCPVFGSISFVFASLEIYCLIDVGTYGLVMDGLLLMADFALRMTLALSGHSRAWRNRRFEGGFSEFLAVQRRWALWAIVWMIAPPACYIFFGIIRMICVF